MGIWRLLKPKSYLVQDPFSDLGHQPPPPPRRTQHSPGSVRPPPPPIIHPDFQLPSPLVLSPSGTFFRGTFFPADPVRPAGGRTLTYESIAVALRMFSSLLCKASPMALPQSFNLDLIGNFLGEVSPCRESSRSCLGERQNASMIPVRPGQALRRSHAHSVSLVVATSKLSRCDPCSEVALPSSKCPKKENAPRQYRRYT